MPVNNQEKRNGSCKGTNSRDDGLREVAVNKRVKGAISAHGQEEGGYVNERMLTRPWKAVCIRDRRLTL